MDKEYIERGALLERTIHISVNRDEIECVDIDDILDLPTADVVEVRHGEFIDVIDYGNGDCFGRCSTCGTIHKAQNPTALRYDYNYCRWCGAKMDGKVEGE